MKYTFEEDFGTWPKYSNHISFDVDFSDEEANLLRAFLKENGDCDYAYLETEHPDLFNRINDAANEAVLKELNRHRKKKLDFFDVDWQCIGYDFFWPKGLME